MKFPAVSVVMSPSTAKGIIDFLVGDTAGDNEEARKIYVGASPAVLNEEQDLYGEVRVEFA